MFVSSDLDLWPLDLKFDNMVSTDVDNGLLLRNTVSENHEVMLNAALNVAIEFLQP